MTATTRIRWHESGAETDITAWLGYAGTVNAVLFTILRPVPNVSDLSGTRYDEWALTAAFPGAAGKARYGDGPDDLKAEAERWLAEFVSSLGAVFPDQFLSEAATRNRFLARVDALEDADQAAGALTDLACMDEIDGINDDQRAALRDMILARFPDAED